MAEFEKEASHLRANLDEWIELFELPFEVFSDAGCKGLHQIYIDGIDRKHATFADHISCLAIPVPKDVIKAMCIGAAHLSARHIALKKGDPFASRFLINAAEEIGYCRGAAFGIVIEDGAHRVAQSNRGKTAADALHSKPGGSRDKMEEIRAAWASGKYSSRDVCAEQECAALGMSFSAARKALRNTPQPT